MEIFLRQGSGDVRDAICQRMFCHQITLAGVPRKPIPDRYRGFHRIHADRPVANIVCYRRNALILANFYVTLARALHVRIWALSRAAFVARIQHPGDALILFTILDGAVAKSVVISCHAVNILTHDFAMRDYAARARSRWTVAVIVER
jgi:hypothetical protein